MLDLDQENNDHKKQYENNGQQDLTIPPQRFTSIDACLPAELWYTILQLVPSNEHQETVVALQRAIPHCGVSKAELFRHVRIKSKSQLQGLFYRLSPRRHDDTNQMKKFVKTAALMDWGADPDVSTNLINQFKDIHKLVMYIGPLFEPSHVENVVAIQRDNLTTLCLRFNPYVERRSYTQFLKGAYFDSTFDRLAKLPPRSNFKHFSFVQDLIPFNPLDSSDGVAQPLILFRTFCLATFATSPLAESLTHLRLRIPKRGILTSLSASSTTTTVLPASHGLPKPFPNLEYLDISTSYVPLGPAFSAVIRRLPNLRHLVLDRTTAAHDVLTAEELGRLCSGDGLDRKKEGERSWRMAKKAWDSEVRMQAQRERNHQQSPPHQMRRVDSRNSSNSNSSSSSNGGGGGGGGSSSSSNSRGRNQASNTTQSTSSSSQQHQQQQRSSSSSFSYSRSRPLHLPPPTSTSTSTTNGYLSASSISCPLHSPSRSPRTPPPDFALESMSPPCTCGSTSASTSTLTNTNANTNTNTNATANNNPMQGNSTMGNGIMSEPSTSSQETLESFETLSLVDNDNDEYEYVSEEQIQEEEEELLWSWGIARSPPEMYFLPSCPSLETVSCGIDLATQEERHSWMDAFHRGWREGVQKAAESVKETLQAYQTARANARPDKEVILLKFIGGPRQRTTQKRKSLARNNINNVKRGNDNKVYIKRKKTGGGTSNSNNRPFPASRIPRLGVKQCTEQEALDLIEDILNATCIFCTVPDCAHKGDVAWGESSDLDQQDKDAEYDNDDISEWYRSQDEHVPGCGHLVGRAIWDTKPYY